MMDEVILRKIEAAIWSVTGSPPRLLNEICTYGSDLQRQQSRCRQEAMAVYRALFLDNNHKRP